VPPPTLHLPGAAAGASAAADLITAPRRGAAPAAQVPAARATYFTTQGLLQLAARKGARATFYRCVSVARPLGPGSIEEVAAAVAGAAEELELLMRYQQGSSAAGEGGAPPPVLEDPALGCLVVEVPLVAVLEGFRVHVAEVTQPDGGGCRFRLGALGSAAGAGWAALGAAATGHCWRWESGRFSN
jgi:hypothetical protein